MSGGRWVGLVFPLLFLLSAGAVAVMVARDARKHSRQDANVSAERVAVRVLLLFGDQAEIVADVPAEERAEPERYPAADIAAAVGVPASDLPGMRLTAEVGEDHRLSGWHQA
ncbi:hypothetical protein ACIHCM_17115 [Streptomyces sp. NPDC052023]|uniref:hypothetical protein n=1 Tax=Streptomyces sp. NPDC052023 TaxID=3365681 RepID=UPI0037D5F6A0